MMDIRGIPSGATAVTLSDTAQVNFLGLYIGTGGDVKVSTGKGDTVTFTAAPQGSIIPLHVTRVWSTGSTASNIVGFRA